MLHCDPGISYKKTSLYITNVTDGIFSKMFKCRTSCCVFLSPAQLFFIFVCVILFIRRSYTFGKHRHFSYIVLILKVCVYMYFPVECITNDDLETSTPASQPLNGLSVTVCKSVCATVL